MYYEPQKVRGRPGYKAIAKVKDVIPDPQDPKMYIAVIEPGSYLPLEHFVPRDECGTPLETYLRGPDGTVNRGKIQLAMRRLPESDFARIIALGYPEETATLPRLEEKSLAEPGFGETLEPFLHATERIIIEETISRKVRDRVFRRHVLQAYESRCAFTGLNFVNGGGRAEVEAAHIMPVADNGPDIVQNGVALSGTIHWMFDRGLIGLTNEGAIMVSRQVNNPDDVWKLVHPDRMMRLPSNPELRPHPRFLAYHRDHCFKY